MKNLRNTSLLLLTVFTLAFSSCKKDDPVIENSQEEFDKTVLTFINVHSHGSEYHEEDTALTVNFINGKPEKSHYHLTAGKEYRLKIDLFSKGILINDEILDDADEHQFFFAGASNDILEYTYEDNVGISGIFEVKNASTAFDINLVLRHGLRKTNPLAAWNLSRTEFTKLGGADDLNLVFNLHPTESGEH